MKQLPEKSESSKTKKPSRPGLFGRSKYIEELEAKVEQQNELIAEITVRKDKRIFDLESELVAFRTEAVKARSEIADAVLKHTLTKDEVYAEIAQELGFRPPVGYLITGSTLAAAFLTQKRKIEIDRQDVDAKTAQVERQLNTIAALQAIPAGSMTALGPGESAKSAGNTAQEKPQSEGDPNYRGQHGPRVRDMGPENWREVDPPIVPPALDRGDE